MSEENAPQKERFLREVEQKLLHRELDARLLEDGLIHVSWNEKPLCSVDRDGIVRFRPADMATRPGAPSKRASTWSRSTAPTAILSARSFPSAPTTARTSLAAALKTGCAFRG